MSLLAINFIFWCCNNEVLDPDDNAIKTGNIFILKYTKTISISQTNI